MFEAMVMIVDSMINQKDVVQEGDNFGHISCIQAHDESKDQTNYNSSLVMLKSECFDSNWYLDSGAYRHVTRLVKNINKVEKMIFHNKISWRTMPLNHQKR
jgi:hypothetical protein